ncbi:MAG: hypothetical protein WC685_00205 [Methylobacter sp.]
MTVRRRGDILVSTESVGTRNLFSHPSVFQTPAQICLEQICINLKGVRQDSLAESLPE